MIHKNYFNKNEDPTLQYVVRRAGKEDLVGIMNVYADVGITPLNIELKLSLNDPNHPDSFKNNGGIFHYSIEGLEEKLIDQKHKFYVATYQEKGKTEKVIACASCYTDAHEYAPMTFNMRHENFLSRMWQRKLMKSLGIGQLKQDDSASQDFQEKFRSSLYATPSVAGYLDSIVCKQFQRRGISTVLYSLLILDLLNNNFSYALLEIYTIKKAIFQNREYAFDIPNQPSINFYSRLGAKLIGTMPRDIQKVGEWGIEVQSNVYALLLKEAWKRCCYQLENVLKQKNVLIEMGQDFKTLSYGDKRFFGWLKDSSFDMAKKARSYKKTFAK